MLNQMQNKLYSKTLKKGLEEIGTHEYHKALTTFQKAIKINHKSWIGHQCIALCKSMIFLIDSDYDVVDLDLIISELNLSLDLSNELKRNIS